METLPLYLAMSLTTVTGLTILSLVGLKAFRAWIDLKQLELSHNSPAAPPSAAQRIDVADLKERIRKLEAIASGVEL
jgi:hypothetical protein